MKLTDARTRERGCYTRKQNGTQVVELAIALPLLCILAFLVTEAAAFVRVHQVINNAAREAARVSSFEETKDVAVVQAAARNYVTTYVPAACAPAAGGTAPAIDVAVNQSVEISPAVGSNIKATRVTVTCNYKLMWVPLQFSSAANIPLRGTAVFRNFHD